jgi:uncharacterized DUF497 family protein
VTSNRFDPAKDAVNREKHTLSLAFGDRIFEDDDHLLIPSIREIDGEERFRVVGMIEDKLFYRRVRLEGGPPSFHHGEKEQRW